MSAVIEHARSMIAYNRWANGRILDAASTLSPDVFAKISVTLAHAVGTQLYWHGNWKGADVEGPESPLPFDEIRSLFAESDAALEAYASGLTDAEWARSEAWWKRWGYDTTVPVGPTLFQVIYHGIQHRAEVAMTLTEHDASPGDLDYIVFLQEVSGAA